MVSLDAEGVASYTFHFNDTANFGWQIDDLPRPAARRTGCTSRRCPVWSARAAEVLLDWMRTVSAGVSYDINVRPTVITDPDKYWAKVQPWLRVLGQRHGIVKASDEDIRFLAPGRRSVGLGSSDPIEVAMAAGSTSTGWLGGDHARTGGGVAHRARRQPGPGCRVPDQGGGHGRRGRHLHGRLPRGARVNRALDLEDCLRRAAAAASIVCSRQGAQPPTTAEVDALIADAAD